jgi:hypothetical protein
MPLASFTSSNGVTTDASCSLHLKVYTRLHSGRLQLANTKHAPTNSSGLEGATSSQPPSLHQ